MVLLDEIVGYYLPGLFGWAFLLFVLISESLLLSRFLKKTWYDAKVCLGVILSNLLTTVIVFFLLDEGHAGGHLLTWIPIEMHWGDVLIGKTVFVWLSSFVGSVIVESAFNLLLMRRICKWNRIVSGTLLINAFTYIISGTIVFLYTLYGL